MNERPLFAKVDPGPASNLRLWLAFLIMPAVSALAAAVVFPLVSIEGPDAHRARFPASLLAGALRIVLLGTSVGIISAAVFWSIALKGTELVD